MLIVGGGIAGTGLECVRLAQSYGFRVIVTETESRLADAPAVVEQADPHVLTLALKTPQRETVLVEEITMPAPLPPEAVAGVNVHGAVFEQLLDRDPVLTRRPRAGAATYRDVFAPPGVVQPGLAAEAVTSDPACLGLYVAVRPGDRLPEVRQERDMPAVLTARGDTTTESRENAQRLVELLSLTAAPPSG
jgi:hypothetical protein